MKNLITSALLIGTISISSNAIANTGEYLISEMEALRDSLSLDDPSRVELTLRLADLYFDVSIKEADGNSSPKELKAQREKALNLYKFSLNGSNGLQKAEGLNRIKIQFQMARLLTRLDEKERAEKYYLDVQSNKETPKKLVEQSALGLAEWYEEDAQYLKANTNYKKAIELCDAVQTCNYAHYRRAWLLYKDTKLDAAIEELKLSLWDQDKNIRENSLQDLLMFMSNAQTDGFKELEYTKELSLKIARPELAQKLTEAFYVAGNRRAGCNLLAEINKIENKLYFDVRLLEEFYGFRDWDKVEYYLNALSNKTIKDIPTNKTNKKEINKILRRFVVQVDAETSVVEELNVFLKRSIDIYLTLYPNDDLRKNMQQGWLKATDSEIAKIDRIGTWISEDIKFGFKPKEVRKLRQTRLSFAQKHKKMDIVLHEALELRKILQNTDESREFTYVAAREYYERKDFINAIPLFKILADSVVLSKVADKWALLSQNLLLDVYNQQKNYAAIMAQVNLWKAIPEFQSNKKMSNEMLAMNTIFTQANFENSASLGETKEGLEAFYNFCFQNVYPEKSCPNAKVLSVKLKDQLKLVSLLEREKDETALMTEYELMGRFTDAARLQEKLLLKRKSDIDTYLKIALLFELDQNFKNRDRILKKLISKLKRDKKIDSKYESAIFLTLDEAGLINNTSLSIPWSLKRRLSLADRLETKKSTRQTRKIILSQTQSVGPTWSKMILTKVQREYTKPSKINFYGRNSKWKFKKRTRAIDKFAKLANSYLEGADSETRIYILQMLKATYQIMAIELQSTPMPEGLDDETLVTVMNQLADMASPFNATASDYERLQNEQLKSIASDDELSKSISSNLESGNEDFVSFIKLNEFNNFNISELDFTLAKELKEKLLVNPEDKLAINNLEQFYISNKSLRVSSYFKGRANNLSQ
jgi:hypothetical protein